MSKSLIIERVMHSALMSEDYAFRLYIYRDTTTELSYVGFSDSIQVCSSIESLLRRLEKWGRKKDARAVSSGASVLHRVSPKTKGPSFT